MSTLTEASEGCGAVDAVLGSFVISWMIPGSALEIILETASSSRGSGSQPISPGKVHHCSMFSP